MSAYRVELGRDAARQLRTLERVDQQRIRATLDLLADNPRPPRSVALRGFRGVYRVRVGDLRVVYEVRDAVLLVLVIRVGAFSRGRVLSLRRCGGSCRWASGGSP